MSKPALFITTDTPSGVALVRGVEAEPATRALAPDIRRYSPLGRGWLVPLDVVSDLLSYAAYYRIFAVTHELKQRGTA